MAITAAEAWRDYETDGTPSSGSHKVKKNDVRSWGAWVEGVITAFTGSGGLIYASKALLDADLAHVANSMAWVYGDATVANNGVYRKVGASGSGSWTRVADLPFSFIIASDAGAGTANAIQATTSIPVSGSALVWMNVFEANTASPVTVSFNGGSALTIKTNAGNDVTVGGLTAGMIVLGIASGSTFRLVSDQASTAVVAAAEAAQAAAEDAQAAAEAAAASVNIKNVADRTALKALNTAATTLVFLREASREGLFKWTTGDFSTLISADTQEGVYIKADAVASSSGAWVRQYEETLKPEWYGALGGSTNDKTAIQAAWDAGAAAKASVLIAQPMRAAGELTIEDDLDVKWNNGAWTRQTAFSTSGSFIENLRSSSADAASIMANITLRNAQIDGSLFPAAIELEVASSTATTVTFTAAASAVDDFYLGMCLEDASGANGGGLRIVTDYVGSTRTATHTTAWSSNPTAGTKILAGWNDNAMGFAAGVSAISITGGFLKNYPANKMVPSGTGGKGINFEQGVTNGRMSGVHVEDCGTAFFVQGVDGTYTNGSKRRAAGILLSDLSAKNCGSALTIAGVNSSADPDGDSDDSMIVAVGLTYENAGHSPWRIVSSDQQKSGIINFLEAQNVSISDVRGRNDATYPNTSPGYPTDYTARVGYGLSGNIGAMVWGWGRNLKINGFVHHGNVDNVIVVRRGRALGDDAGATGAPQNCFNWSFRGLEHHGVINEYVIRIDPTAGLRVAANELTGEIEVSVNGSFVTGGIVDPNMSAFSSLTLTVRDHVNLKTIIGTPAQIYAAGNTFASFPSGVTDLRVQALRNARIEGIEYTLADDTAVAVTPPRAAGMLLITSDTSLLRVFVGFRTTGGAQCVAVGTEPASFTADNTDGTLTGTTGVDTEFTVRASSAGSLYFENRRGASVTFRVTFLG
jgi:hypothetical protein